MSIEEIIKILDSGEPPKTEQDIEDFATAIDEAIALLKTHPGAQPNDPLTLEELREMDGEVVYLAEDHKWWIVSLNFPGPWGKDIPCGVDKWGAGTSLSLLARCGVYRRPPEEETHE